MEHKKRVLKILRIRVFFLRTTLSRLISQYTCTCSCILGLTTEFSSGYLGTGPVMTSSPPSQTAHIPDVCFGLPDI